MLTLNFCWIKILQRLGFALSCFTASKVVL